MIPKTEIFKSKKYRILKVISAFIISFIVIASIVVILCTNNKKEPYQILKINGNGAFYNYSKSIFGYVLTSDSAHSTSMMVNKGDLLINDKDESLIYYTNTNETELNIAYSKPFSYINKKIHSIAILKDFDLLPWFKQMKPSDISDLQSLKISSVIPESYYPYLLEIAKTKPSIGLFFEENFENKRLLKIFKPTFLVGITLSQKDCNTYSNISDLQLLVLSKKDSSTSNPIPHLPGLKQLIIPEADNWYKCKDLLALNKQIERISIAGDLNDVSFLQPLTNLKELNIVGFKNLKNNGSIDFVKNFKQLEVLTLFGDKCTNLSSIDELPHLRWLSLLVNSTQKEFESILEHHKNLEMLEVFVNSTKSLQPLTHLEKLYGLVIINAKSVDPVLISMKKLKYLSISNEAFVKDGKNIALLQKSLPGCTIVPNHGFCLGSGWLLLLLPLMILFRICFPPKEQRLVQ